MKLEGRVALVTGGGSGIGRAAAQRLAGEGMRVCVLDIDGAAALTVAESLDGLGLECDVSDAEQVNTAFASCVEELGSIHLAFLNAGITIRNRLSSKSVWLTSRNSKESIPPNPRICRPAIAWSGCPCNPG